MRKWLVVLLACVAWIAVSSSTASAQNAQVIGAVKDSSGAVVPAIVRNRGTVIRCMGHIILRRSPRYNRNPGNPGKGCSPAGRPVGPALVGIRAIRLGAEVGRRNSLEPSRAPM